MGFWSGIWDAIVDVWNGIVDFICDVIDGIISFVRDIVNWFKSLRLQKNKDIPFIMDGDVLREQLQNAPVENVGIFEAVFDEEENCITAKKALNADEIDDRTAEVLSKSRDGIVVLN